jgi:hypothetical protein
MPSSPSFEVIADAATQNLIAVEGDTLNGTLAFTDEETGEALNLSGMVAIMTIYSGVSGVELMRLNSASGDLAIASGTVRFSNPANRPPVGTWPYVLKTSGASVGVNTILGPALFKVISQSQGLPQ